ncbi:hypothetical protein PUN28_008033 [Cardiocondyla obscurior]|uniref:Uncharacterized protein n=1 Tax=Cardiocondyla obscurior TaxID=286306 RepID=A0AAW2G1Z0_9HYME
MPAVRNRNNGPIAIASFGSLQFPFNSVVCKPNVIPRTCNLIPSPLTKNLSSKFDIVKIEYTVRVLHIYVSTIQYTTYIYHKCGARFKVLRASVAWNLIRSHCLILCNLIPIKLHKSRLEQKDYLRYNHTYYMYIT